LEETSFAFEHKSNVNYQLVNKNNKTIYYDSYK